MDRSLIAAAQTGNVEFLHKLIEDDPLLLYKVSLSGNDTPLHIASMAGQVNFVQEILNLRKEFTQELNQDGVSPLHIASANGHIEIVKELLKVNRNLCLQRGRERRVPLHYASIKGRDRVMRELLICSPDSVEEITARGESPLHLAVKNNQFDVLLILVDHLKEFNKEGGFNKKDEQGNTVLHLAVSRKQYEVVDLLLGQNSTYKAAIEVNSVNKNGLTPLDTLFLFQSEAGDREIEDILKQAGATRNSKSKANTTVNPQYETSVEEQATSRAKKFLKYFHNRKKDLPSEVRNTLLVITSLIAAATYQAVLQPPGGVWQDDRLLVNGTAGDYLLGNGTAGDCFLGNRTATSKSHTAGRSVMGDKNPFAYGMFLLFNSIGYFTALNIIYTLTAGFPLQMELQVAIFALTVTYDSSMSAISPGGALLTFFIIISAVLPVLIPIVSLLVRKYLKKPRNCSATPSV